MDLLRDGCRGTHRKSAAAILFWDQRREESGLREGIHEFRWIAALAVELAPVLPGKAGANRPDGSADLRQLVGGIPALAVVSHISHRRHHTGSQANTSDERSSGVKEGPNACLS